MSTEASSHGQLAGQRARDLLLVVVGAPLVVPLLLVLSVLVRVTLGGPVFFRQRRPGLHGHPFELVKFRTMSDHRGAEGILLPDVQRLGRVGRLLRASSLDELPEILNVLRGEMSLVGPRPLLMEYLPLYSVEQARRHDCRPGITGHAQVTGRNAHSWEERFAADIWYVDRQSHWLDLRILFRTVAKVMRRDGITAPGDATMPRFAGGAESQRPRSHS